MEGEVGGRASREGMERGDEMVGVGGMVVTDTQGRGQCANVQSPCMMYMCTVHSQYSVNTRHIMFSVYTVYIMYTVYTE